MLQAIFAVQRLSASSFVRFMYHSSIHRPNLVISAPAVLPCRTCATTVSLMTSRQPVAAAATSISFESQLISTSTRITHQKWSTVSEASCFLVVISASSLDNLNSRAKISNHVQTYGNLGVAGVLWRVCYRHKCTIDTGGLGFGKYVGEKLTVVFAMLLDVVMFVSRYCCCQVCKFSCHVLAHRSLNS